MNFDLSTLIKDKKSYPDALEIPIGDGLKMTLGELRQFQEATGQDVAKQLEAERTKLSEEQKTLAKAQEEVVALWAKLQEATGKTSAKVDLSPSTDWTKDPFFAPIAEHLDKVVMAKVNELAGQYTQVQKALGLGVKYITDNLSEMRYHMMPEDFRKEVTYEQAVKTAAEKKFLDSGGVPDIRKVHDEWRTPRERDAERKKIEKEAYEKAKQELAATSLVRPSGLPVAPAAPDPDAPKTLRESFNKLKQDPEFLQMVYGTNAGGNA